MAQTDNPKKQNSKNYFIAVSVITLIFIAASLLFWFKYLRPVEKGTESTPFTQINLDDATIKDILKPEANLFETCITAKDIEEYESKKANIIIGDIDKVASPEFIRFPVEFYSVPVKTVFEIETNDTIFLFDKSYCELTSANWQVLISPLDLENVIDYVTLRNVELSAIPKNTNLITILAGEDYLDYDKLKDDNDGEESLEVREATVATEEAGKIIFKWVYYHPEDLNIITKDFTILKNGLIPKQI